MLHANGFRAAAACEAEALRRRGDEAPTELSSLSGTPWTFVDFPNHDGVTPRTIDQRFPGARVTDGTRTVPLLLAMTPLCEGRCDEKCEEECGQCGGTGASLIAESGLFEDCATRQRCGRCLGLKWAVISRHFSSGSCPHTQLDDEMKVGDCLFRRCRACGLAAIFGQTRYPYIYDNAFACAVCSRFACVCEFTRS